MTRAEEIRQFILNSVEAHPKDIVSVVEQKFGVTRTTVHRHLNTLIKSEKVLKSGTTNTTVYTLPGSFKKEFTCRLTPELSESAIWEKYFSFLSESLPKNVYDICYYGFTEIFNNAIDHSEGTAVHVQTTREKDKFRITIYDNGIGIFKKIRQAKHLANDREAVLELSKGKLTTDPQRHSGEGIFFSSRMFDEYAIWANGLCYLRNNQKDDWFLERKTQADKIATLIRMEIDINSSRQSADVFKHYMNPETLAFDKTHIMVNMSQSEEDHFVSRSQAKRILTNLEKFNHIVLDFKNVTSVGQAFVDEVFRVFKNQHPSVEIDIVNASEDVRFMIERGRATADLNEKKS